MLCTSLFIDHLCPPRPPPPHTQLISQHPPSQARELLSRSEAEGHKSGASVPVGGRDPYRGEGSLSSHARGRAGWRRMRRQRLVANAGRFAVVRRRPRTNDADDGAAAEEGETRAGTLDAQGGLWCLLRGGWVSVTMWVVGVWKHGAGWTFGGGFGHWSRG